MAWSPDGTRLATIGKDHMIRIYEPRSSTHPTGEGAGPSGSRGARIVWVDDEHLVVSGFNRWTSCMGNCLFPSFPPTMISPYVLGFEKRAHFAQNYIVVHAHM